LHVSCDLFLCRIHDGTSLIVSCSQQCGPNDAMTQPRDQPLECGCPDKFSLIHSWQILDHFNWMTLNCTSPQSKLSTSSTIGTDTHVPLFIADGNPRTFWMSQETEYSKVTVVLNGLYQVCYTILLYYILL